MSETKKVYAAIAKVCQLLAVEGISKARKNQAQGYQFRGIDDVYNALSPALVAANLCILPNVLSREVVERESQKGGALFYTTVRVDFAFVSAEDASEHHVVTYGEAMDSGDKSTNKAMSAAYKYAAMQAFCIPTEGDNDADSHTHEVKARPIVSQATRPGDAQDIRSGPAHLEWEAQPLDIQNMLLDVAHRISSLLKKADVKGAYNEVELIDMELRPALASQLSPPERAMLKAEGKTREQKAA